MQSQVYTFTNALAVEQSNCLRAALLKQKVCLIQVQFPLQIEK